MFRPITTTDNDHAPSEVSRLSDPELQDVMDNLREPQIRELLKYLVLLNSDAVRSALSYVQAAPADPETTNSSAAAAPSSPRTPQYADLRGASSSVSRLSDFDGSRASSSRRSKSTRKNRRREKKQGDRHRPGRTRVVDYELLILCTSKPASPKQSDEQDKAMVICKQASLLPYIVLKEAKPQRALELVMISKCLEYPQFFLRCKSQRRHRNYRAGYSAATVSFLGTFDLIDQLYQQDMLNANLLQREEEYSSSSSSSSYSSSDDDNPESLGEASESSTEPLQKGQIDRGNEMLKEQEHAEATIAKQIPSLSRRLPVGGACYLVFDKAAWELNIYYSEAPVIGAVGLWTSSDIQAFKETEGLGTSELIGNCASRVNERRNYFNGWCQFVKAAKNMDATVLVLEAEIPVEFCVYTNGVTTRIVNGEFDTAPADAVACIPHGADFAMDLQGNRWIKAAKKIGDVAVFGSMRTKSSNRGKFESLGNPQQNSGSSGLQLQTGASPTIAEEVLPQEDEIDAPPAVTSGQRTAQNQFYLPAPLSPTTPLHNKTVNSLPPQVPQSSEDVADYSSALTAPNPEGGACYLLYEPESSGRLVEYFSKTPVTGAIGRWVPVGKKKIAGFKFKQNLGKNILIGNCSAGVQGRKNYCSGWCQFVRSARVMQAEVMLWDPVGIKGMMVDVYLYNNDNRPGHQTIKLQRGVATSVEKVEAVACIPKKTAFYEGICVDILRWLADGGNYGASSKF